MLKWASHCLDTFGELLILKRKTMKKQSISKKHWFPSRRSLMLFAAVWLALVNVSVRAQTGSVKICSASDLHYFNPSLLISDGTAFQEYLAQDRKLITESRAITQALVKKIKEEKPDIFLVTGDLTKDGEKLSHQDMAKYLDSIEMNGVTKVYVIPGNHDVNNVDACSYDGATTTKVDSISPSDFKTIYNNFGYAEAADVDPASLSYLAKPKAKLWVLGLDVCMYDSNMVRKTPVTEGRFKPATYKWVLARLAEAKAAGATVIGMMHHGLTEHYTGQSVSFPEYVVDGWDTISVRFADAGLKLMFTGHYHANDITEAAGTGTNFVFDIETGSTVTWPCPYRVMHLNADTTLDVVSKVITDIDYNTNGETFQVYAKEYLNTGMTGLVKSTLMSTYGLDESTALVLTPHVVAAYAAHYAGDEKIPATETAFISYLNSIGQATYTTFASMLTSYWTDLNPADNNVVLSLKTGSSETLLEYASSLPDSNYTTPSWTTFKKALVAATDDSTEIQAAIHNLVPKNYPYNVNMTLNGDPTSRMGFDWFTNKGITSGSLQIVKGVADSTGFASATTFDATTTTITDLNYNVAANQLAALAEIATNTKKSYVGHKAVATGLTANTTYSFRVGTAGAYSTIGTFTTAKSTKDAFTFMYFTDTQAQCDSMFDISQRTVHAAKTTIPGAKFALVAGDLIESSGASNSEWEYEQWFETMQDVWNTTPLAPIGGNHDKSTNQNFAYHFNTLNPQFDKDMSTVPGSYYSFVYGNALFMSLSYEDYSKTGILDSAANWMSAQVKANPTIKWRIAFYHKTMFTGSSSHQSDADGQAVREKMGPVFDSLKINLAIQGHDHVYEVIGPVNGTTRKLIPGSVTNQTTVAVDADRNLTGVTGGTYDVNTGTLYFLNSSAGIKKYVPRTEAQMAAAESAINMTDYWSLFTGRFGQTGPQINGNDLMGGDPMFSSISICTDSISVVTYSVGKHTGVISKFDAFKIVKYSSNAYKTALSLADTNYTVPSWTTFRRVFTATPDDSVKLQAAIDSLVSKNKPYNVNMTINGAPSSRLGFAWFTNKGVTSGSLQVVEGVADSTGFAGATTFDASTTDVNNLYYNVSQNQLLSLAGIADTSRRSYVSHKAVATGLNANTTYSYRVGTKGAYSTIGTFTTANGTKDPFTFMYFTDTQAQCDSMFDISQRTVHAAKTTIPDAKFALVAGDLVESSGAVNSEWEYEQWFETMQDVWNTTPLAPIGGNHDKGSNKNFTYHFNTLNPQFDKDMSTVPGSYYSFVYGDALFMALSYEDYSKTGILDSAANWMSAQVKANPTIKWRIAFYHKTMFTGSASHQSDADGKAVREKMGPVFDSLKINLAIQGHDHVYEVIGPVNGTTRKLIPGSVTNQTTVAVDADRNLTGVTGGTYDVNTGTLYFLNSSAGIKKYVPRTEAQMTAAESAINMTDYWSLFTGRFGQTGPLVNGNDLMGGDPMFSSIRVCSDSINIVTYSVGKHTGVITQFDAFKVISPVAVTGVVVSEKAKTMVTGTTSTITATVSPSDAANQNVTWSSTDATIADVADGTITAKEAGEVSIIVTTADGAMKDTCKLTVTPATTSIQDNELQEVTVSPNPTTGTIHIAVSDGSIIKYIEIVRAIGQSVTTQKVNNNAVDMDLSEYSKGSYFVIIHTNDTVITKLIILQ
jgi:acid phosphatase type 7